MVNNPKKYTHYFLIFNFLLTHLFCRILKITVPDDLSPNLNVYDKIEDAANTSISNTSTNANEEVPTAKENEKLLDPFCHYNTSLNSE